MTSEKRSSCVFLQTLGAIYARIVRDFAQILKEFSQIFDKSKLSGMRLHPRLLHHCHRTSVNSIFLYQPHMNALNGAQAQVSFSRCRVFNQVTGLKQTTRPTTSCADRFQSICQNSCKSDKLQIAT